MIEEKYEFDVYMQQMLLGAMLKDPYFLKQSSSLVKPFYFEDKSHEVICDIILQFFDKYRQVPKKEYIEQEIKEKIQNDDIKRDAYIYELRTVMSCYEAGIETREYLTDKVAEFTKIQTMRQAIVHATDILGKKVDGKWEKIYKIFNDALTVEKNDDDGIDYFNTVQQRYENMMKMQDNNETFTSGFPTIDKGLRAGGICRGECAAVMGSSGVGKSLILSKQAIANCAQGKKVLYITLELSAEKTALRMDSQLSGVGVGSLAQERDIVIDAVNESASSVGPIGERRLIIKQFAAGTLTVKKLRSYLSMLHIEKFVPDLICLDYLGELSFDPAMPMHQSYYLAIRDLRALAMEEKIVIFTGLQGNRSARDAQNSGSVLQDSNLSGSYDAVKPLDALWSINQSTTEKSAGVGRIWVAKHRDGRSGYLVHYKCTDSLDMVEISNEAYANRMNAVVQSTNENVSLPKNFKQNSN
jgi:replicative DNA helicase